MMSTEGKFSLAACLRWNGMRAQTLNKEEGVLVGDRKKWVCLVFAEVNAPCDSSRNLLEVWLGKAWGELITKHYIRQEGIERQSVNCSNSRRDERQSWRKFKLELKTEQGKKRKRWWTANIDWLYLVPHSTCTPCGCVPHFHKSLGLYLTREKKKNTQKKTLAAASREHKAWRILHHAIILRKLLCGYMTYPLKGCIRN